VRGTGRSRRGLSTAQNLSHLQGSDADRQGVLGECFPTSVEDAKSGRVGEMLSGAFGLLVWMATALRALN